MDLEVSQRLDHAAERFRGFLLVRENRCGDLGERQGEDQPFVVLSESGKGGHWLCLGDEQGPLARGQVKNADGERLRCTGKTGPWLSGAFGKDIQYAVFLRQHNKAPVPFSRVPAP